ncbi:hypothetical protein JCM8208_002230 [Rhodotorula glutinis]
MRPTELLAALAALSPLFLSASASPSTAHDSFMPVRLGRRTAQSTSTPTSTPSCGLSKSKHQLYLNPLKGTCVAHCPFGYYGVEQTKTCTKCSSAFGSAVKTCDKVGAKSCNASKNGVPFMLLDRQCVCPLGMTLSSGACVSVPVVAPGETTTSAATTTTTSHTCTPTSITSTTPAPSPTTPPAQDGATSTSTHAETITLTVTYDEGDTITVTAPEEPTPVEEPSTPTADSSSSASTSVSSSTTTTSTSSTASSSTSAAAPSPTVRLVPGWSYQGCWRDLAFDGHVLPNDLTSKAAFTVESCLAACATAGYAICGLEYKGECWGAPGVPRWTEPVDHCDLACKNDPTAICGGSAALTAYVSESIPWVEPVGNEQLANYGDYTYQGCYADLVVDRKRVLPRQHTNTEGRVESCLDFCASKGASYCGLEYYGECFYALAGESLSSASTPVDDSLCRFSCRGAPYEDCGGKASLSLWKTADRAPPVATYTA